MPKLPEFETDYPILKAQPIVNKGEATEKVADVLGGISQKFFQEAEKFSEDANASQYLKTRDLMQKESTQAHIEMIQNPGNAGAIEKKHEAALQYIAQNSIVNKKTRSQLTYDADSTINEMKVNAADQQVEQARLMGSFNILSSVPTTLEAYQKAILKGDEKDANALRDNTLKTLKGAVASRILTPTQGASIIDSMHRVSKMVEKKVNAVASPTMMAHEHSALAAQMGEGVTPDSVSNENTNHLYEYQTEDLTQERVMYDIGHGNTPNPIAYGTLPLKQKYKADLVYDGASKAKGYWTSNLPYQAIEQRRTQLNSDDKKLPYAMTGERDYLNHIQTELQKGNYQQVISETAIGSKIVNNFTQKDAAIRSADPKLQDPKTSTQLRDNENDMISKLATLGNVKGIPNQYINPIPMQRVTMAQSSFQIGNNPSALIQQMDYLTPENRTYLAGMMKTSDQKQIAEAVGYSRGENNDDFQQRLILYSQKGQSYDALKVGKDGQSEGFVRNALAADPNVKNILNYFSLFSDGNDKKEGFLKSGLNYIKGEGIRHSDIALSDYSSYAKDFGNNMSKAYPVLEGPNYRFHKKIVDLTQHDAESLTSYIFSEAKEHAIDHEDFNKVNCYVTITPDRHVVLNDPNGHTIYHEMYSSKLMSHVEQYNKEKNIDIEKAKKDYYAPRQTGIGIGP